MTPDWNLIVREHGPMVYRVAWRILDDAQEAEDVGQEVFLELHRMLASRRVRNLGGLLRRLATLRALDRLRRRKTATRFCESAAVDCHSPEAELVEEELAGAVREAIARLPERMAAVFCLRYAENLSNLEIAEVLKISPSAVSTNLGRARQRLAAMLQTTIERRR
jgi:RNA polymerase sigma-70 factor (ECF subfamily)